MPDPIRSDVVGAILGKRKTVYLNRPSDHWVLETQTIGVEIEVEGNRFPLNRVLEAFPEGVRHYWEAHEDHSLHDNGVEFTFREPLFGEDAREAIEGAFRNMEEYFKLSKRAGIHVHLDARDLSRHQLLGLMAYYAAFEPAIYRWVGDARHGNNFCIPWYKYNGAIDQAGAILRELRNVADGRNDSNEAALMACNAFHRYAGLNLKSLHDLGSIEFRHLLTTFDVTRVKEWINLIFSLKKAAMEAPDSSFTILDTIRRRGIADSLSSVFGGRVAEKMLEENREGTIADIVEHGLPNATELIVSVMETPRAQVEPGFWEGLLAKETEKKKNHPGFDAWRNTNYPKDEALNPEDPPQRLRTIDEMLGGRVNIVPNRPRNRVTYSVYKVHTRDVWIVFNDATPYVSPYFMETPQEVETAFSTDRWYSRNRLTARDAENLCWFSFIQDGTHWIAQGFWRLEEDEDGNDFEKFYWVDIEVRDMVVYPSLEAALTWVRRAMAVQAQAEVANAQAAPQGNPVLFNTANTLGGIGGTGATLRYTDFFTGRPTATFDEFTAEPPQGNDQ